MELETAKGKFNEGQPLDALEYVRRMAVPLKLQFLESKNSKLCSYLRPYAKCRSFLETNCEITAFMLRYLISGSLDWSVSLTLDGIPDQNLYQISIGSDEYDIDHILTVYKGFVVHSFYKKFSCEIIKFEDFNVNGLLQEGQMMFYHYPKAHLGA